MLPAPAVTRKELLLSQHLLNILQLPVYIRILPAKPRIETFGDACYPLGDLSRLVALLQDHPDGDASDEEADQRKADIQRNQNTKIVIRCGWGHTFLLLLPIILPVVVSALGRFSGLQCALLQASIHVPV